MMGWIVPPDAPATPSPPQCPAILAARGAYGIVVRAQSELQSWRLRIAG